MPDGKHAQGLRGFPTPNVAAGIAGYLLFLFEDKEWAQWILGALEPLAQAYNYYESGDLSVDEAAELFRVIVQDAPYNLKTCANPDGGKILRVSPVGHVQELSDANTWENPTGDYEIPPVPEREGGTEQDQICLAARNAANVLELLYENITDSFNADLDEAEAATALTLTLTGLIGAEFAPITFALITFFGIVFGVLYGLLEFIGADLWDEDFTNTIACILIDCASNDAGVVTFDYECFNDALAAQVNIFSLTFEQLRLFGQIQYLLLMIGGVDALNQAGATTAITDDDCGFCSPGWCYKFDDASDVSFGTWVASCWSGAYVTLPTWDGTKWNSGLDTDGGHTARYLHIRYTFTTPALVSYIEVEIPAVFPTMILSRNFGGTCEALGTNINHSRIWDNAGIGVMMDSIDVLGYFIDSGSDFSFTAITLKGQGNDNPVSADNCV